MQMAQQTQGDEGEDADGATDGEKRKMKGGKCTMFLKY